MRKTDQQRIAAYVAGVVPATVSVKFAAALSSMNSGFATAMQSLVPMEQAVQAVLNGETPAIPTIKYPFYLNFGRELWKRQREGIDGKTLAAVAQSLHDKYVGYGLATAVLVAIADQCFHITVT